MLIVHHLNNSRSQRVLWMLEEIGLGYTVKSYERRADMSAPLELKALHPLGKSPVVEDLDGQEGRVVLVETGAVCEYLAEKVGGKLGVPSSYGDRIRYRQFLHYAEGSVMPILFAMLVLSRVPFLGKVSARKARPMLDVHLDFIENELSYRPWFAGNDITAADIMMSFPLEAANARGLLGKNRKATLAWLDRIHARPAYQRALEKGGAYSFARPRSRA